MSHRLVDALDPDRHIAAAQAETGIQDPGGEHIAAARSKMIDAAVEPLMKPEVRELLADVKRSYEQVIDETSKDRVISGEFSKDATDRAKTTIESFRQFIEDHKDEITALQVLYSRPYAQRLTFADIRELADAISRPPRSWTAEQLWDAYEALDHAKVHGSPGTRPHQPRHARPVHPRAWTTNSSPTPTSSTNASRHGCNNRPRPAAPSPTNRRRWLHLIRDHLAASLTIEPRDLLEAPFTQHGGLGKASELFDDLPALLDDLNTTLAA